MSEGVSPSSKGGPEPARPPPSKSATDLDAKSSRAVLNPDPNRNSNPSFPDHIESLEISILSFQSSTASSVFFFQLCMYMYVRKSHLKLLNSNARDHAMVDSGGRAVGAAAPPLLAQNFSKNLPVHFASIVAFQTLTFHKVRWRHI